MSEELRQMIAAVDCGPNPDGRVIGEILYTLLARIEELENDVRRLERPWKENR